MSAPATSPVRCVMQTVAQVGPDDYERRTHVLDVNPDTTVAEIMAWHDRRRPGAHYVIVTMIRENQS